MKKIAKYFKEVDRKTVRCLLCPHRCLIGLNKRGICKARFNEDNTLYTDNYGDIITLHIEPIEKKPLYHFYPAKEILSTGPNGCNFSCKFCQNWQISQRKVQSGSISCEKLVEYAKNTIGIAYTYTEPTIWFEYMLDCAKLAKKHGLKNVMVTNGYIEKEPFIELAEVIDAVNIDLKSFDDDFYNRFCGGRRKAVMETIELAAERVHLEITNLVITGLNDVEADFRRMVDYIADISPAIPLHISRYYPAFELNNEPTSKQTIERFVDIASEKLYFVYAGNIATVKGNNTICPSCKNLLIKRTGYSTLVTGIKDGKCTNCQRKFDGII